VLFLSSIPSLKIQKKQNRPRSSKRPKLIPINREIGAVEFSKFEERIKAVARRAAITKKEMPVRIFSCFVHRESAAPGLPGLLLFRFKDEIRGIPR
jgi:hypothetical protein